MKNFLTDILYDFAGGILYGTGIVCFLNAGGIVPGGVSGISIMLNFLFSFPLGTTSFIINIPIIILGFLYLGKNMMNKTLKSVFISSLIMDVLITPFFPIYTGEKLLASLFGGLLVGVGLAVIFMRGSTTGGTDIVSYLIKKKYPHFSIGRAVMITDCIILSIAALVFKSIENIMYGLITTFFTTTTMDKIIYGADKGSLVFIISSKTTQIANKIITKMERGATLIDISGAYSGQAGKMIVCAVRRHEYARIKAIVEETDKNAFLIASEAEDVIGEGFKLI